MTSKLPISVCIISGAEAKRIDRALASVAPWVAEIIVVLNDDVTDGTDAIALKHGAKVFRETWKGHIAQKNSAAAKAAQPWVLGVDADEAISDDLRNEIQESFAASDKLEKFSALAFPRCTLYAGRWIRHGEWYPDYKIRLWRNGKGQWGGVNPHDKLVIDGPILKLRKDILHFSNEDLRHQMLKAIAYSDDFVRHCDEQGKKVGPFDFCVRPFWRFFRGYIVKAGFLDGWQGFSIARMTSMYTFFRYMRVYEVQKQKTRADQSKHPT